MKKYPSFVIANSNQVTVSFQSELKVKLLVVRKIIFQRNSDFKVRRLAISGKISDVKTLLDTDSS